MAFILLPKPVLEPVLYRRGQDQGHPQLPMRGHTAPQPVLPLCWLQSALLRKLCVRLEDSQDPHKRE